MTPLEAMSAADAGDRRGRARASPRCAADAARYFEPGDPAALAAAMAELAAARERRRELAERGRAPRGAVFLGSVRTRGTWMHTLWRTVDEDRDPWHARHPRVLQRLRDRGRAAGRTADRARARGDGVLPPARRRPQADRVSRRAPDPSADDPQQVPRHVRPHVPVRGARVAGDPARRRAVLHRRQLPAVPDHARGVDPDADQRRRPRLRPRQVAGAGQGVPAVCRAHRAALGRRGDHRQPRRGRDLRAPLRPADRRRAVRSARIPATTAARRSSSWASRRGATSCSSDGWSPRTILTCWSRRSRGSTAGGPGG